MDTVRNHLSYSQIQAYLACPLKHRLYSIEKVETQFNPVSLVFGTGLHKAVASYYIAHRDGGRLPEAEMVRQFHDHWKDEEAKKEIRYNGDGRDDVLTMAERLIAVFYEKAVPMQVLAVEQFFSVPLFDDVDLYGVCDLIEADEHGTPVLVDLKSAAKRKSPFELSTDLQMTAYSLGLDSMGLERDVLFRFDVLLKQKAPDLVKQYTVRSDYDRQRFIRLAREVWTAIEAGICYPNPSYYCQGCQYKELYCDRW